MARSPAQRGKVGNWLVESRMARGWDTQALAREQIAKLTGWQIPQSVYAEWASLVRALAVTAGIVIVSLALAPHAWLEWAARLITSPDTAPPASAVIYVPLPLIPRLLLAAGITTWAALTDRRWAVFIAAAVALPVSSGGAVDLLLGALPLLGYGPLARVVHHDPRPVRVALNADLEARWRPVQAQQS